MDQGHARLHYAVPLAMERAGILALAFCDYFRKNDAFDTAAIGLSRFFSKGLAERMHDRYTPDLPPEKLRTERAWTLWRTWLKGVKGEHDGPYWDAWAKHRAKLIGRNLHHGNALHGYITSLYPPLLREAGERGLHRSGDQIIAPVVEQERQAALQHERFPGYAKPGKPSDLARLRGEEERTWPELDLVTCPSPYVREVLGEVGVDPGRVAVLPYPFDVAHAEPNRPVKPEGPLVVGFVGAVNLRKGTPYFVQVAKRLASERLKFRMIGPVDISDQAVQDAGGAVEFCGGVPRSQVKQELRDMDVFFFPSTCEGSAGVLYEASSMALPIVTSPNSGTHLRSPDEAVVLPYDDIDGYVEAIAALADDAERRRALGQASCAALSRCSLDAYAASIRDVLSESMRRTGRGAA